MILQQTVIQDQKRKRFAGLYALKQYKFQSFYILSYQPGKT